jgi:DNA-binding transcriptional regulator/RsmH inhibitor MraZ
MIIYGGSKSQYTDSMIDTARSDIFLCHIEELHTIRKQIEDKHLQKGIQTISVTRMHIEEMEEVEFDTNGRITKAKRIRNVNIQNWGATTTTCQNEDILI